MHFYLEGKATQFLHFVHSPPETLLSYTPGRPENRITHISVPGPGTFPT
jgi:hypothetical protein